MNYVLDLLQGLGIAAGIGIRPFLPTLLVGALAAANVGIDFGGTDFSFLEKPAFLLAIVVLVAVLGVVERRRGPELGGSRPAILLLAALAVVLGALLASGSIADRSGTWWPGIIVGAAAAALGFVAARSLFGRVRARLDRDAAAALPLYAEAAGVSAAGLSVLLPPLAILIAGGLLWLLVGGRRRAGEKYAGLRILR
jgi:Na+-translocating ferredoxin:NAD+ oxidoreductase RnfA subunit